MAHDVFISYSSKDKPTADAVCAGLEAKGIRVWIAPRDILPGADYGESIVKAISASAAMILVFSNNANVSQHIKNEVERAVNYGLTIIPFRIENIAPSSSLEFFLSTPHWLDAFSPPLERHIDRLAGIIAGILNPQPISEPKPKKIRPYTVPRNKGANVPFIIALVGLAIILSTWGAFFLSHLKSSDTPAAPEATASNLSAVAISAAPEPTAFSSSSATDATAAAPATTDDYILPTSDQVLLTREDVAQMNRSQVRLARNEIFARHGFRFKSPELQAYFATKSWYTPTSDQVTLTPIEQENVKFLKTTEDSLH